MDPNKPSWETLSKDGKEQMKKELQRFAVNVEVMNESNKTANQRLHEAADYLDKVWKDCRIATAVGSGVGILGSMLTIGGGIATLLTAGLAAPVLIGGIVATLAGTGTSLGTAAVEDVLNSTQVQEADKAIEDAKQAIMRVTSQIELWKERKPDFVIQLVDLAVKWYGSDHYVVPVLGFLLQCSGVEQDKIAQICGVAAGACGAVRMQIAAGENVSNAYQAGAGARGSARNENAIGGTFIAAGSVSLVLQGIHFGFTVRDLVENKGSDAAKALREKADEIEASMICEEASAE